MAARNCVRCLALMMDASAGDGLLVHGLHGGLQMHALIQKNFIVYISMRQQKSLANICCRGGGECYTCMHGF